MTRFLLLFDWRQIALPLKVGLGKPTDRPRLFVIQFLMWLFVWAWESEQKPAEKIPVQYEDEGNMPVNSPTKAYADQRQKATRNRRRKPKKAMANLYHLN